MIRRPPRSTLFPTRRSSDLVNTVDDNSNTEIIYQYFSKFPRSKLMIIKTISLSEDSPEIMVHFEFITSNGDRKSTRLNSSHVNISYAVFCLKKKNILQQFIL